MDDEKLLEKYKTIWTKIADLKNMKNFYSFFQRFSFDCQRFPNQRCLFGKFGNSFMWL